MSHLKTVQVEDLLLMKKRIDKEADKEKFSIQNRYGDKFSFGLEDGDKMYPEFVYIDSEYDEYEVKEIAESLASFLQIHFKWYEL